jgi:hypothetical protein
MLCLLSFASPSFRSMTKKEEEPIVVPDEKKKKKVTHGCSVYATI